MESWKNELYHHGILGMKWGKKNGPPYPLAISDHSYSERKAGWQKSVNNKKRKMKDATYTKSDSFKEKWFTQNIKAGKDKAPVSRAEKVGKETENAVSAANRITKRVRENKDRNKPRESKSMTDEQLKKAIDRMQLEQRYDDLKSKDVGKGKSWLSDVMDYASDVVAIGASAAAIYAVIRGAKG